ncbi:hypothetical protein [Isoptericola sp. NPDC019482]|uniref:hypothetical protein n=1 Tax=Isoptericola sp. NPDC019482 TaxID=3154688 RepID=UPI00346C0D29
MSKGLYRTLFLLGAACAVVGFPLIVMGREALGLTIFVGGLGTVVVIFGATTIVQGLRSAFRGQSRLLVPDAPVATPDHPSQVDQVVSALEALNSPDLPYEITAERDASGAVVSARWRTEELRWQGLFTKGQERLLWRMRVALDPARARYRFTEWSGTAKRDLSLTPGGVSGVAAGTWHKGKTAGQLSFRFVMVPGGDVTVTTPEGPRTSFEGAVAIRPRDVKIPVFRTLRNHGWRPPHDWWGARWFEG